MSRALAFRSIAWTAAVLALAGCSARSSGSDVVGPSGAAAERRVDQATHAACRQRANEMFERRNRAEIYAPNSSMNSPYSANYTSGVSSHGLASQFAYENAVIECERNAAGAGERTEAPEAPAPAPAAKRR